eukprot:TRINITY_DN565_c0_g1_i1.p1 TRINITY_DN565_c0_g1~~TRINITY_DN565_c0_g1_i1.p1  ORF type:complete len:590 (-),score=87.77 TRINITY_DN565_c0_g1_i1:62-1831(-)
METRSQGPLLSYPRVRQVFALVMVLVLSNAIVILIFGGGPRHSLDSVQSMKVELSQPQPRLGEVERISSPSPPISAKERLWRKLKFSQGSMLDKHQYCMLWCSEDDPMFSSSPEEDFYRDLTDSEAIRDIGSYYTTEGRDVYQNDTMAALGFRCCQIATRDSFTVMYDTRPSEYSDDDVTLVTFGTFERVDALYEVRARWRGPIVFVLYVSDHNDVIFKKTGERLTSVEEIRRMSEVLEQERMDNIAVILFHARFEMDEPVLRMGINANYYELSTSSYLSNNNGNELIPVYSREEAAERNLVLLLEFPINALRNVAQDYAETRFVFATDLDFMPSTGAYEFFKTQTTQFLAEQDNVGIVLPHFERRFNCGILGKTYAYPQNFLDLDRQFKSGMIRPFHCELHYWAKLDRQTFNWPAWQLKETNCTVDVRRPVVNSTSHPVHFAGIGLSNYTRWLQESRQLMNTTTTQGSSNNGSALYEIPQEVLQSNLHMEYYEPYILLDRVASADSYLMRYNEVFVSRYRDKASWIFALRISGYRFFVAPGHFLIHRDHDPSPWVVLKGGKNGPIDVLRDRMDIAGKTFIQTLKHLYA